MTDEIRHLRIGTIKIVEQLRTDRGDLEELAVAISKCLLQPSE
jgi:hypothetical protein